MRKIPLSGKKGVGLFALVDDEDYERVVAAGPWYAHWKKTRLGGAVADIYKPDGTHTMVYMHKLITGFPFTDHKDMNVLNNQKNNLRPTGKGRDANVRPRGKSKYKGVNWYKARLKWRAAIEKDGHQKHLGLFDSEIDAAMAYDRAARELHTNVWLNCEHFEEVPCLCERLDINP